MLLKDLLPEIFEYSNYDTYTEINDLDTYNWFQNIPESFKQNSYWPIIADIIVEPEFILPTFRDMKPEYQTPKLYKLAINIDPNVKLNNKLI